MKVNDAKAFSRRLDSNGTYIALPRRGKQRQSTTRLMYHDTVIGTTDLQLSFKIDGAHA